MESPLLVALKMKLAEWDDTAEETQASPTTAAPLYIHKTATATKAQQIHDYIAQCPGLTAAEYVKQVRAIGIEPGSSRTLISQMFLVGLLNKDENTRVSVVGKYKTINGAALTKARRKKAVERKKAQELSTPIDSGTPDVVATKVKARAVADIVRAAAPNLLGWRRYLETLNVIEAKALYLALKELFTV